MNRAPAKTNPFPGLRPFTQEEDYLFFGREEQTIELLQRLGGNRFVAVVGTSGSGKSSLVRCGLLSQLLGGKMLEAGAAWEVAVTHPGGNPLALLTDALLEADLYDREQEHARENLLATLSRSHFGLVEAVKQADLGEGTNFLLVVDQFEEIFRFHEAGQTQQEAANEFVSLLLEAVAQKEVPIYVVLTMRSDFIGECGQFEGLAEMVNQGEFLIPRLNREQYKRVIEGPIKVAGGQIAPRLLQRLLNDLGQQTDQLPCLQHALMRTWNVWAGKGDTDALDLNDYQCVGKMSLALSLHADEIYESLASDRQRALCQGIFQALTVEESNSRGIRRPQRLGRLCQILEAPADELRPIIDAYRQSGVTFLMPSPEVELTDQTILDISHESLMRVWTRLRQWVEEETQAVGIYHRLSESAHLHERGKAGLYRDPELGIALAWRESKRPNAAWAERYHTGFATAMGFLEASQQASAAEEQSREAARQRELEQAQQLAEAQQLRLEHQQRAARKLRMMIGGLAVVAIVAVLACVAALVSNKRANDLAVVAKQESSIAEKSATEADRQRALAEAAEARAKGEAGRARIAEQEMRRQWYAASSNLMQQAWDTGQVSRLRALLAETEAYPDRGFEWYYWQRLCHLEEHTLIGHRHEVTSVSWSPDRTRLATGSRDGTAKVWEAASGRELLTLRGFAGPVLSLAWSPDGQRLATGNQDGMALVWDATGRRELLALMGGTDPVLSVAWSRDGTRLATGSADNTARVCDAASGRELLTLMGHVDQVYSVAWSPDGQRLATASWDGTAKVWDAAGGRELLTLRGHVGEVYSVAWSPDGTRLATGNQDRTASVWDAAGGRELLTLKGHAGWVWSVAWSPDGQRLATGSDDSTAKVWDAAGGRDLLTLKGHTKEVRSVSWSPDGTRLVTGSFDRTAKMWDAAGSRELLTLKGHPNWVWSVSWSPDGTRLATGSFDRTAKMWNAAGGRELLTLKGHTGMIWSVAWSPDGQRLATASADSTAKVWEAAGGRGLLTFKRHAGVVRSVAWSPDGQRLATASEDTTARVWEAASGRELLTLRGHVDPAYSVAWSPDGTRLATASEDTTARVWEAASGRELLTLKGHAGWVYSVAWSPDGQRLTTGSRDGTARVWEAASGRELLTLRGHASWVWSVAWSPDGIRLATASEDTTARVWEAASGRELLTLRGHVDPVYSVSWSPDGQRLATASWDGTAKVWDAASAEAVRRWARQDRAAQDHTEPEQPEDAATAFAKLLNRTPESQAAALMRRAEQSRKAGQLEQTRQFWEKVLPFRARAVAQRPDDRQAWRDLGTVHAALGQPEEAAAAFTKLVELTPESQRAVTLMGLAELEQTAGRPDRARHWWAQAVPLLTRAVAQRPDDRQGWRDLGTVHAALGQPEEAAAAFTRLVELTPESYRAVTLMGLAELDQKAGRPDRARHWWAQAVPLLTRAVAQRPDDPQAWTELGSVHAELGQPEEAATAVARLMELTPESQRAATLMNLAELDQKAGRPERARQWWARAISVLTRAVAQRPDDRQAWKELGIVRAELGQPEEAAAAFTKLMELTPDSRDKSLWWAPDPAGIGEALAAHDAIFGRVVRARPRDRTLLIARFHYFGRRRRWREAAETAARIVELDPQAGQAPHYRRALLLFTGDLEGYRPAIREELAAWKERSPNFFGWLAMLGQFEFPRADATSPPPQNEWESLSCGIVAYREGQYAGAIRHLPELTRPSTQPFPRTLAHLFLAMAHQRLGQVAEARRELDAVRKGPDVLKRDRWFGVPELASGELMSYGWTELVIATIVLREAEAMILYDPIFPADPFAR